MSTVRKLAREAVIFMLLGPVVTASSVFAFLHHRSAKDVDAEAARAVFAFNADSLPPGYRPDNSVLVPLTNGVQLYVADCAQYWRGSGPPPGDSSLKGGDSRRKKAIPDNEVIRIPPGATDGSTCVYFYKNESSTLQQEYGGRLVSVRLGDENQVAIEEEYWQAYARAKSQHPIENTIVAAAQLALWGFPGGLILWVFYRLIRFAVKG